MTITGKSPKLNFLFLGGGGGGGGRGGALGGKKVEGYQNGVFG